jgi:hypothetical protein
MEIRSSEEGLQTQFSGGTGDEREAFYRNPVGQGTGEERAPGVRPGTYIARCDTCKGGGIVRVRGMQSIWETCILCDGTGKLVVHGQRHGDVKRREQPTWGDIAAFCLVAAGVVAGFCLLILWNAHAL